MSTVGAGNGNGNGDDDDHSVDYYDPQQPPPPRLSRHWDIKSVRRKHLTTNNKTTKRICIEMYDHDNNNINNINSNNNKKKNRTNRTNSNSNSNTLAEQFQDTDRIIIRLLKPKKKTISWGIHRHRKQQHDDDDDDDDSSEDGEIIVGQDEHMNDDWEEYRKYTLHDVTTKLAIDQHHHNSHNQYKTVTATLGNSNNSNRKRYHSSSVEVRDFIFDSPEQAKDFHTEITNLQQAETERANSRIAAFEKKQQKQKQKQRLSATSTSTAAAAAAVVETETINTHTHTHTGSTQPHVAVQIEKRNRLFGGSGIMTMNRKNKKNNNNDDNDDNSRSTISTTTTTNAAAAFTNADDNNIHLLIEIVSASDLPIMDIHGTADPFVTVWLGDKEIHKTAYLPNTLDPIWTLDTGSLFIMSCSVEEFFRAYDGLTFVIYDFDSASRNDLIGQVTMSQDELLEAADRNEKQQGGGGGGGVQERIEKTIQLEETDSKKDVLAGTVFAPKLVLRCRKAGPSDIKFLRDFEGTKHGKKLGVYAEATFVGPKVHSVHRLKRETRPSERKKGLLEHRVKPGPDPAREEQQTKWLTEQEIEKEAYQPSTSWIESGSGDLGKLYVEIIGCDGLPNLDIGLGTRDKSDPFCTIIFEDAIASTEVINDCLSPRWMPWSQRAFVFRVAHMSSQLLIGVFDYDNPTVNPHDAIGRVSIDTTNFRNDTVYILHYDLHTSTLNENRETCGRLTVRVRLDSNLNPRNALLSSMRLPTQNYINVAQKTAFKNARFVCSGEEDMNLLDIDAIKSYRQELMDYKGVLIYIFDAVKIVILWRGHFDVSFWKLKLKLPLHSITAFLMGIFLVENYNLIPSCTLFCITWLLFATNEERHRNPSPWMGALTIREMWYAIATGKIWQETIVADENKPLIEKYEATRAERLKDIEGQMKRQQETSERTNSLFKYEEEETAVNESQTDITTKTGNFSLNPLKPVLLPIQKILGSVCVGLRVGRSILTWDESFYAFIIAHACLIAGIAIIWVPWSWLIRWLLRIVVWVCLGPWFGYTLDFCFVRKLERHSSTTLFHRFEKSLEKTIEERGANLALRKRQAAIKKENALKLRSVKQYMFGNYIVRVPRFKEYRWTDVPRPESTATPVEPGYSNVVITDRKHGQRLVGDMIPVWGDAKELSISQVDAKHESLQQQLGRGVAENVIAPSYGAIDTVAKPFVGVASRVTKPLVGSISSARTKAMDKVNPMKVFKRSYHG